MSPWAHRFKRVLRRPPAARGNQFTGDYRAWADAAKAATGYDAAVILEKTRDALLKVKSGEAVFERDSVLFREPQYPFPVLAGLLRAAALEAGRLSVLDFGGSLGSSYFQCRRWLSGIAGLEWLVVEQAAHVACGRQHFASRELRFFETAEGCLAEHRPNVLLLSGVLQYLPEPYAALRTLLAHAFHHVIVDRAPFLAADRDRLTVQHVPETIYPASYPAWFFSETRFAAAVNAAGYQLVAEFPGADTASPTDEPGYFKGFLFDRNRAP